LCDVYHEGRNRLITPINVLKKIPLFASLAEADQQILVSLLRRETLKKGETLFRQGDEGIALYLIVQGRIKISMSRRMDTITLAILSQGEFLGEMALLDGLPRSADAIALEQSYLYVLNRKDFLSFLIHNEKAVRAVLASLSMRLRKTDDTLAEMCFLNLSVRMAQKLAEMAELQAPYDNNSNACKLKMSQQEFGNILGVSRESINKELKRLRDKGVVSTARNCIYIHNLDYFKKHAP
jgi:CRP/FNR family cyclic AMP-dependent transcriptional regulator